MHKARYDPKDGLDSAEAHEHGARIPTTGGGAVGARDPARGPPTELTCLYVMCFPPRRFSSSMSVLSPKMHTSWCDLHHEASRRTSTAGKYPQTAVHSQSLPLPPILRSSAKESGCSWRLHRRKPATDRPVSCRVLGGRIRARALGVRRRPLEPAHPEAMRGIAPIEAQHPVGFAWPPTPTSIPANPNGQR